MEWPASHTSRRRLIMCLHCTRFPVNSSVVTLSILTTPVNLAASSRTQAIQFFRGLPLDLFPWFGFQCKRNLGIRSSGILTTCPYQRSLAALINVSTDLIPARLRTSSLVTWKNHFILRILLREVWWKPQNVSSASWWYSKLLLHTARL